MKPRMPRSIQFFENAYPQSSEDMLTTIADFDGVVHQYYDLRNTDRPVDAFSNQIAGNAVTDMTGRTVGKPAARQGFRLDR